MSQTDLQLLNRELSWLEFNQRVLDQARHPEVPLLERLKFLAITGSNLDEFFMVRVGGLQLQENERVGPSDPSGPSPTQQLEAIHRRVVSMVESQYRCLSEDLEPALQREGMERVRLEGISTRQL